MPYIYARQIATIKDNTVICNKKERIIELDSKYYNTGDWLMAIYKDKRVKVKAKRQVYYGVYTFSDEYGNGYIKDELFILGKIIENKLKIQKEISFIENQWEEI